MLESIHDNEQLLTHVLVLVLAALAVNGHRGADGLSQEALMQDNKIGWNVHGDCADEGSPSFVSPSGLHQNATLAKTRRRGPKGPKSAPNRPQTTPHELQPHPYIAELSKMPTFPVTINVQRRSLNPPPCPPGTAWCVRGSSF